MAPSKQADFILLDFSKTFNKVNHIKLLSRLHLYGIKLHEYGISSTNVLNRLQDLLDNNIAKTYLYNLIPLNPTFI